MRTGHFSISSADSSPNCYGSAAKGAGYHRPMSSLLPEAGESTKKPAQGMTALLEKCIPAALLKLQATAQLFAFTNIFKEAFLGSDRTCLQMQIFQKKGREGDKKRRPPLGSPLFHSDFNHQIKCQLFPFFINLWCLLYSQFQCSWGTREDQITTFILLRA